MRGEPGFFDADQRLKEPSAKADDLKRLNADMGYGGLLNVHPTCSVTKRPARWRSTSASKMLGV
jgi:hypothetical protein